MRTLILGLSIFLSACGVKGPPLPPVSTTPQKSDDLSSNVPSPKPSPSSTKRR